MFKGIFTSIYGELAYMRIYKSDKRNASVYFCLYVFSFNLESKQFRPSGPWALFKLVFKTICRCFKLILCSVDRMTPLPTNIITGLVGYFAAIIQSAEGVAVEQLSLILTDTWDIKYSISWMCTSPACTKSCPQQHRVPAVLSFISKCYLTSQSITWTRWECHMLVVCYF